MSLPIILASGSVYRQELLKKTGLNFTAEIPAVDETGLTATLLARQASPAEVAGALSLEKARAVAERRAGDAPPVLIIAGDQLVSFDGCILGKPLSPESAVRQLELLSGRRHELITAITLQSPGQTVQYNHITRLTMRPLSTAEIAGYVRADSPLDCAGSYKIESRGITLFEHIECDDFTAIQGIPMIWLSNRLKERGYEFFKR